jgi:hypothetical protein
MARTPDQARTDGLVLHKSRAFDDANAAFDEAVRTYLQNGRLGDAAELAHDLVDIYSQQRDYKRAHSQQRRAWLLDEGIRALDAAATADDLGDQPLVVEELRRAHAAFVESGYEDAAAITTHALGVSMIDLTAEDGDASSMRA